MIPARRLCFTLHLHAHGLQSLGFRPCAILLACLLTVLLPASLHAGGLVLIKDAKPINGPVAWTADAKLTITPPGKTTQTYDLQEVRTAVIDTKAAPPPNQPEANAWFKKELGRDKLLGISVIASGGPGGGTHMLIRDNLDGLHFNRKNGDACSFVYQKLEGDCELIARILPKDDFPRTKAGLMIREGLELDAPMLVLLRGAEGSTSRFVSVFGGRETRAANSEQYADSKSPVFGACWLKLVRTADNFTAYDSPDGKKWSEIASKRLPFDLQKPLWAGVCSASYGKDGAAGFERVSLTTPMQSAATAPIKRPNNYLLTRGGSILAADLVSLEGGTLKFRYAGGGGGGGDAASIPLRDVIRFQLRPLSRTLAEKLDQSPPGIMTSDGDFVEGEIQALDQNKIRLSSITFGITTLDRSKADALIFHDPPPAPAASPSGADALVGSSSRPTSTPSGAVALVGSSSQVEVRLQDNSVLQAKSLTLDKDRILIQDPQLGPLRIPPKDILLFDRKK